MSADPLLSVFPPALLRLVLCGGEGLPAAWGPLVRQQRAQDGSPLDVTYPWDPFATRAGMWLVIERAEDWRLPLDHWRPRLALVAAWMLDIETPACYVQPETPDTYTGLWCIDPNPLHTRTWEIAWRPNGTGCDAGPREPVPPDLPTLPAHLLTHDPAVALILALFDVSEIRAKVEALNG